MKLHLLPVYKVAFVTVFVLQSSMSCANDHDEQSNKISVENKTMASTPSNCKTNRVLRSQFLIKFIFDDINKTYTQTGGGGITSIKETATDTFEVSIAQEERMDVFAYQLSINDDCEVTMISKEESTISFGR